LKRPFLRVASFLLLLKEPRRSKTLNGQCCRVYGLPPFCPRSALNLRLASGWGCIRLWSQAAHAAGDPGSGTTGLESEENSLPSILLAVIPQNSVLARFSSTLGHFATFRCYPKGTEHLTSVHNQVQACGKLCWQPH
jgi:hypothetical protein